MIVDPDFFDHWRTRMVSDLLGGDPLAPIYIMRLWAHCQNRKGDTFDIPTLGIKAICQFSGDAKALEDALIAAEYMDRDGLTVTVVGWAEKNATLIASWNNGRNGGRPKKNPDEAQGQPNQNPRVTQPKPTGNPPQTQTEPIREEKRREEEVAPRKREAAPLSFRPEDVSEQVWSDWLSLRKQKKAIVTQTVVQEARKEAALAGLPLQRFLEIWCLRGSQGLKAAWLKDEEKQPAEPTTDWRKSNPIFAGAI